MKKKKKQIDLYRKRARVHAGLQQGRPIEDVARLNSISVAQVKLILTAWPLEESNR